VAVAVPGHEVLQRELVDAVVVFCGDAIDGGLPVLAQQDQRRGVCGLVENSRFSRMNGYGSPRACVSRRRGRPWYLRRAARNWTHVDDDDRSSRRGRRGIRSRGGNRDELYNAVRTLAAKVDRLVMEQLGQTPLVAFSRARLERRPVALPKARA